MRGHAGSEAATAGRGAEMWLELADQLLERLDVCARPTGPVDDGVPLDDARQRLAEALLEQRHDGGHRPRVVRVGGAQLGGAERAGRRLQPARGDLLDALPVHQAVARRCARRAR